MSFANVNLEQTLRDKKELAHVGNVSFTHLEDNLPSTTPPSSKLDKVTKPSYDDLPMVRLLCMITLSFYIIMNILHLRCYFRNITNYYCVTAQTIYYFAYKILSMNNIKINI